MKTLNIWQMAILRYAFVVVVVIFNKGVVFGQSLPTKGTAKVGDLVEQVKLVQSEYSSIGTVEALKRFAAISANARARGDYGGFLVADLVTRIACCAAYKALVANTVTPDNLARELDRFESIAPSLEEWKKIYNAIAPGASLNSPPDVGQLRRDLNIGGWDGAADFIESNKVFSRLIEKNDYKTLAQRILITDSLQNQVLPIALSFRRQGGEIMKINPANVAAIYPIYETAQREARPTLIHRSGDLAMLKDLAENLLQTSSVPVLLMGYELP